MQNSYTKKGQLSWWLALLEYSYIHKGRGSNTPPFKTQKYFNFYSKPTQACRPAQLEGPQTGPRALDLPRARPGQPIDQAQWPALGWVMGLTPPGRPAWPGLLETLTYDHQFHVFVKNIMSQVVFYILWSHFSPFTFILILIYI